MNKRISKKIIAVIGGGYTGLSASIELLKRGYKVYLFERSSQFGGLGKTIELTTKKECEAYYHHFFIHDNYLLNYSKEFTNKKPVFSKSSMSIFYKNSIHNWNGLRDLFNYPHINFFEKLRFVFFTLLISKYWLRKDFIRKNSLVSGLKILYGQASFNSIWEPMILGKFGNLAGNIPFEWMCGRLSQRFRSRKGGIEYLGYLPKSISKLTNKLSEFINQHKNGSTILRTDINSISKSLKKNRFIINFNQELKKREIECDQILFTTSNKVANILTQNISKNLFGSPHNYFTAYCILLELRESLSESYWMNIADNSLFYCGYIEHTRLTGIEVYGGIHLAYLTKYTYHHNKNDSQVLDKNKLKEYAYICLAKLFPEKNLEELIIKMHINIANNAQVVTDFKFRPCKIKPDYGKNLYIANMSNVYPDERSINNAIKIGCLASEEIYKSDFNL